MTIERMDADTFLAWCTRQEGRYELVDGNPRAMVGARARHDRIVVSALVAFRRALAGTPCEPFSGDFAVRIPKGNIRRPDVTIDCGATDDDRLFAQTPTAVVEVLSPSTRQIDLNVKVAEYQSVPSIAHILLIEPEVAKAVLFSRTSDGRWSMESLIGPDAAIPLPGLGIALSLSDFYE
ncbi:Uma2 family endonuclease [Mongoliimonas terrestris]|uniref:Uma2 family endonuclease n=1 Tax=Mongoliimonas terrestris TaxID=1709001 RepID=UPI0015881A0B|nr:Uma2 family endonuclease [Mongoliimonas terrestris]